MEKHSDFNPDYTPIEMFKMGIFGNCYFKLATNIPSQFVNELNSICYEHRSRPNYSLNAYGVECGTSLEWWQDKGLIHVDDPNGWVEWYIKYYYGRRHNDDARQIARFNAFKSRHGGMLKKFPDSAKTKQNLLQWAINYKLI